METGYIESVTKLFFIDEKFIKIKDQIKIKLVKHNQYVNKGILCKSAVCILTHIQYIVLYEYMLAYYKTAKSLAKLEYSNYNFPVSG